MAGGGMRTIHAVRGESPATDHRPTQTCPCLPVAFHDLAEPGQLVFVHRTPPNHESRRVPFSPTGARTYHRAGRSLARPASVSTTYRETT